MGEEPVYVISLVALRKKFRLFLLILIGLVVLGFVLPRVIALLGKWLAPATGWLKSRATAAVNWTKGVFTGFGERLEPFVETLKQYYQGR